MKYINLFLMTLVSFVSMYVLMYMMVDSYANVYPNLNQFYMAAMMTAPMVLIELLLMGAMYPDKKLNALLMVCSVALCGVMILFIRKQTAISDKEFLKSMIPHHAAAILMCEQTSLKDPEIQNLCKNIVSAQQSEIAFMKAKLQTMKR